MLEDKDIRIEPIPQGLLQNMDETSSVSYYVNDKTKCVMEIATGSEDGEKWATIYTCRNYGEEGKGHMSEMFEWFARSFADKGFTQIGCTVGLKPQIKHLCEKYNITEYK